MIKQLAANFNQPFRPFSPCPPASDRTAWEAVDDTIRQKLIMAGEVYLNFEWPALYATDFMEFTRTGNRNNYENKLFLRRTALDTLVLAECAEHEGRFMDDIINGLFLICGENAWQLPAHNSYIRDTPQFILPDAERPVVDLFAAETAAVLATAEYVLREELNAVSPSISRLVNMQIEDRVLTPYLTYHFWWMGDGKSHMNNWTVWCTQNVLLAAFTRELPDTMLQSIFHQAAESIDYFLDEYGEDGCCDEGVQYYRHAGLCLFGCMEILNQITDGCFSSAWQDEKVKNIAAYILNAHIDGPYYVNFADCSPVAGRCNAREYLFGKRTGNQDLMAFAAQDYQNSEAPLIPEEHNLYYRLLIPFTHEEMTTLSLSPAPVHRDIFYSSAGLFAARDSHLYLAVKAGDNDDSHNHNDTGSFTVYKDGKPFLIDVGVETYTKKTFSPDRYDIWTMQSQYHNLPTFHSGNEIMMQKDGPEYCATDVTYSLGDEVCRISMDIAKAYPGEAVRSYLREAVLEKGHGITIADHFEGESVQPVLSLMTYEKPTVEGSVIQIGSLGSCTVEGAAQITTEMIPITDERLKTAWEHELYRCLITMKDHDITLTIAE